MAGLVEFQLWFNRVTRFASSATHLQTVSIGSFPHSNGHPGTYVEAHFRIFTDKNAYSLHVREPTVRKTPLLPPTPEDNPRAAQWDPASQPWEWKWDSGYLGCTSTSRKERAGEDWHRGSDLADGPLDEVTWNSILADIVSYELVEVVKDRRFPQQKMGGVDETPPMAPPQAPITKGLDLGGHY